MKKVLIICGPTGTGKTKLAIELAKAMGGELINADSRQIYKGLDALTGKDRSEEIRIWLYDVVSTDEASTVSHFVKLAHHAIFDIHKRGKLPIVVGGTGFYIRALTQPFETIAIPPNWPQRKHLETLSLDALQKLVDPKRLARMNESDSKNPRRLMRAIEVAVSAQHIVQPIPSYDALWVGLTVSLAVLKERISERVSGRFEKAVTEVRDGLPPILGADPLLSFVHGESTKEEAIEGWVQAEYQYAKRQMTWFRKEKDIHWFDVENPIYQHEVESFATEWYTL